MPARLLLFCALLMASASSQGVTLYKITDDSGVISYSDRPGPGAKPLVLLEPMVETLEGQVLLNAKTFDGGVSFSARNELHVPVEVELRLDNLVNAQGGDAPRIVRRLLPPRTTQMLSVLRGRPGLLLNYRSTLLQAMGDPGNAMDIAMPEGTPIIAAREGVVVKTQNSQSGRGPNPSGNFVRILHPDGTMGVYLHLMRGSVVVAEGQRVRQGQMLAKSGNTGNSTGPHLHFVVQRNVGLALESIPYRFDRPISGLPDFTAGNP